MKRQFVLSAAFCGLFATAAFAQTTPAAPSPATQQTPQGAPAPTRTFKAVQPPTKSIPIAEHFPGGQDSLYKFLDTQAQIPMLARRNRIQGECIIGVTINADGSLSNFKILKEVGGGLGNEALRLAKLLKFNSPGYAVQSSLPITFKL